MLMLLLLTSPMLLMLMVFQLLLLLVQAGFGPLVWQQVVQLCRKAEERAAKRQRQLQQKRQRRQAKKYDYSLRPKQRKSYNT